MAFHIAILYDIYSRTRWQQSRDVILHQKRLFCVFEPPFGGLGATYDDHLRLIGKHVVDFLLVLIELLSLDVMAEALKANISSKLAISLQWGPVDKNFMHQPVFFSEN